MNRLYSFLVWSLPISDESYNNFHRAVDEEGYEYCLDQSVGGFVPVEKTYHLCRRRRWVRTRKRNPDSKQQAAQVWSLQIFQIKWYYLGSLKRFWCRHHCAWFNTHILQQRLIKAAEEGWEYSRLFTTKFHLKMRTMDMVRGSRVSYLPICTDI